MSAIAGNERTTLELAQEELRKSEERTRSIIDVIPDLMFQIHKDGTFLSYKGGREDLYAQPELFLGKKVQDVLPKDLAALTMRHVKLALDSGEKQSYEYDLPINGQVCSFESRMVKSGVDEVVAVVRDITERKRTEESVQQVADEWSSTFDSISDLISIQSTDCRLIRVNKAYADAFGMEPEELAGKRCFGVVHGSKEPTPDCPMCNVLEDKEPFTVEFFEPHIGAHLEVSVSPILDEKGEVARVVHIAKDITERKKMEEELDEHRRNLEVRVAERTEDLNEAVERQEKEVEERSRAQNEVRFIQSLTLTISDAGDLRTALCAVLEKVCVDTGWNLGEIWSHGTDGELGWSDVWYHSNKGMTRWRNESKEVTFREGEGLPGICWSSREPVLFHDISCDPRFIRGELARAFKLRGGVAVPVLMEDDVLTVLTFFKYNPLEEEDERWAQLVFSSVSQLKTIIERKRAEDELRGTQEELIQSEKMASLGLLVAGVAHEVNNPLAFLRSNSESIVDKIETINEQVDASEAVDTMALDGIGAMARTNLRGIDRIADITRTLKRFAAPDAGEMSPSDVNQGIRDTLLMVHNQLKHHVTVHEEYGDVPKVVGRIGQLNQVFMNMILNASQAMEKGNIWVRTRERSGNVYVEVRDDGEGIADEDLDRLFDPFFTTKDDGTGLGLSTCYRIIQEHGGSIKVKSTKGKGATFTICIPVGERNERKR
ncbi:MAG: PAS domain-containing protein [Candidatus Undinarchaeales archaeon]|nr:PAS domain-containing protein [Candidatus Undinarchaeales archaeon]MDP7494566.1 PAS domain-containing protein [Candidatus Undinarchaeales archaeon]